MKKSGRRILSIILTAVMVFALLPIISMPIVVKADDVQEHDHSNWAKISTWEELKELGKNGGSGYLVNNIEISEKFAIKSGKTVNLCLNGYSITQTADYDTITVYGTLNLYDESKKTGIITHANGKNGAGVFNLGTFTMNGGTISGNYDTSWGGVLNYRTFTMTGGTISGNNATYYAGGVYNGNEGTFTMTGGTISGNNATYYGGGVSNSGTFTMEGGTISGNNATYGGGVYNYNYGTFTMTEGTISGNKADSGGGVYNSSGTFTMNGGTISGNEAKVYGGGVYNGKTFTMNGGTISENKAKTDADDNSYGGGVYNTNEGTFTMKGGTISENKTIQEGKGNSYGGGVSNSGTFTMEGGTISGNNATYYGGGVFNHNKGTFTMEGGTISGNNADYGGGVFIYEGTFTMNGGTISENNATKYGGGVFNHSKGTFTMTEGTISGNEADYGGGVYNYLKGTFTMNGGTISGNNANYNGGGVENWYGTFTMTEGTIKNNTANKGSGVYSNYSFVKEGGNIKDSIEGPEGFCTVTFNANGGSGNTIIQYVFLNEETELVSNTFSYGNYPFGCWNTNENGNGDSYKDRARINIIGDLELYARWIEKSYEVTFNVNNGSWEDETKDEKTITVFKYVGDKELKLNASDIPTLGNPDIGYKTSGSWDTKPDTENALTENKTYTYTFKPIEYTIKYDSNGGTGTMNNQSRTYNVNAALTANAFSFEGRTFDGWNTAADGSGTPFSNGEVTGNLSETDQETITLYAQWTTNTFTVSWKNYDGTVLETDKDVAYGSTPTYDGETPVRAKEGNKVYTFSGWTPEIDIVKGAATYTATYSEEVVEQTEPETPQNPTEPETPEEPEEEIPEKDWLDDLRLALNIAAEPDSEKTVEYSGDFALPYEIMNFLVNHPDITFVYHVTYEGQEYTITIPAGKAVAYADTPWYGPLWLLANYGGNNAPTGAKGNGTYIVKAGDTLTGISVKLGVTIQYLVDKNGIKNPDYIVEGQELIY